MTSPDPALPTTRRSVAREAAREAFGLLLILTALAGLGIASIEDPLIGFASLCVLLALLGWRLTSTTIPEE